MRSIRRRLTVPTVALTVALTPVLAGCSDDSAGPETGASVDDVAADEPLEEPAAEEPLQEQAAGFVGQTVTVSAELQEVVSPYAVRIGEEGLLVLSGGGGTFADMGFEVSEGLAEDDVILQVTGEVRTLVIAEFEEEFGVDLDDDLLVEFEGQNVIVADDVSTLVGEQVTVAGEVGELISTVAFRLDGVGWDVVVLDAAQAAVSEDDFVQVQGTVRRFELATLEQELGTDLDDALYEDVEGDLVLVAQSVTPTTQAQPAP